MKVPTNINVIEGEKLKIHCLVRGLPLPEMSWEYSQYCESWREGWN